MDGKKPQASFCSRLEFLWTLNISVKLHHHSLLNCSLSVLCCLFYNTCTVCSLSNAFSNPNISSKKPFNKEGQYSPALDTHPIENEWWPYLWITAIMALLSPSRVCHGGYVPQGQKPRTAHWHHHSIPAATLITIHVIQMRWAITWPFFFCPYTTQPTIPLTLGLYLL